MDTRRLLTALAVALLVVLAGCGGTISTDTPSTTTATPEPTTATSGSTTDSPGATTDTTVSSPNGTLSVHMINVGQGGSTLVVGPTGEKLLIDTGDWRDDGEIVLNYLKERGIERIDYLVTTHPDADHIGGHAAVIDTLETEADGVGAVYDPGITSSSETYDRYLDAIETHDITLYETRAGDTIPMEGADATVLAPPAGGLANGDKNENSIVLRLGFGASSLLIPGDGESASESYLIDEYGPRLNVSVLSAGHHGSASSTSEAFLSTTSPRIALISSGYDSQYGHPHEEVLHRLSDRSIPTYWTGTHGTVRVTSNGSAITVATQADAPTAPLALRDGQPVEPGSTGPLERRMVVPVEGAGPAPIATDGGTTTTQAPTTTRTSTSTDGAGEAALSVATIHADAEGNDHDNLNDEYVVFENTGDAPLDLSGWTIADEADHTYTVPSGVEIDAGAQITLHTGSGTDTETDLYWGSGSAIWNNAGDTVIVRDASGNTVLEEAY